MSEETRRTTTRVGDTLVVTDVTIATFILPASVQFADILAATKVKDWGTEVEFEGFSNDGFIDDDESMEDCRQRVAIELAEMMEEYGVQIEGRSA